MLADLERLGEKSPDLSDPGNLQLVILRQLMIHTQDSDYVLERLEVAKDLLNSTSNSVVLGVHAYVGIDFSLRTSEQ